MKVHQKNKLRILRSESVDSLTFSKVFTDFFLKLRLRRSKLSLRRSQGQFIFYFEKKKKICCMSPESLHVKFDYRLQPPQALQENLLFRAEFVGKKEKINDLLFSKLSNPMQSEAIR
jgi:hypothetical protein